MRRTGNKNGDRRENMKRMRRNVDKKSYRTVKMKRIRTGDKSSCRREKG